MKTTYPQLSEWSEVSNTVVERRNSLNINNKKKVNSNNTLSKAGKRNSVNDTQKTSRCAWKSLRACLSTSFCCGLILGILTAGLILAVILALWLTSVNQTSTTTTTSIGISTTMNGTTTTRTTLTTSTVTITSTITSTTTTTTKTTTATTSTATISNACTGGATYTTQLLYLSLTATLPWTQYSFNYLAPNISSATLTFALRNDPSYWYLDDISVTNSIGSELLLNGGFEQGSYSKWTYCNPTLATFSGDVNTYKPHNGSYSYEDGSVSAYDYLSQAFTVVPNNTYSVKFWLRATSNSSSYAYITVSS